MSIMWANKWRKKILRKFALLGVLHQNVKFGYTSISFILAFTEKVTNGDIFSLWGTNPRENITLKNDRIIKTICAALGKKGASDDIIRDAEVKIRSVCSKICKKYQNCGRNKEKFLKTNEEWLKSELVLCQ